MSDIAANEPHRGSEGFAAITELQSSVEVLTGDARDFWGDDIYRSMQQDAALAVSRVWADPTSAAYLTASGASRTLMTAMLNEGNYEAVVSSIPQGFGQQMPQPSPSPQTANGWTMAEAERMDAHISQQVAQQHELTEPSNASYRLAEALSDPTSPIHDVAREAQADAYRPAATPGQPPPLVSPQHAPSATVYQFPPPTPAEPASTLDGRTYLSVPFTQKNDAKKAGARWDTAQKGWFAPPGADLAPFAKWMPEKTATQAGPPADPRVEFAQVLQRAGLYLKELPVMDGQIRNVPVEGNRGGERSGSYVGYTDGIPAGFVENFKTGERFNWKAENTTHLDPIARAKQANEAAQARAERDAKRELAYAKAAGAAAALWAAANPVTTSTYLGAKDVGDHGLRQGAAGQTITLEKADGTSFKKSLHGTLMVPLHGPDGKITSLQLIEGGGEKLFMPGGKIVGSHMMVGDLNKPGPILIAEGYATAATVHELTGHPVAVALTSGNLPKVAELYRARHPERAIYIAADDDRTKGAEGKPNVGRIKAEEAAKLVGGKAMFPAFPDGVKGSDWNDLAKATGKETTSILLHAAVRVATRQLDSTPTPQIGQNRDKDRPQDRVLDRRPSKPASRGGENER